MIKQANLKRTVALVNWKDDASSEFIVTLKHTQFPDLSVEVSRSVKYGQLQEATINWTAYGAQKAAFAEAYMEVLADAVEFAKAQA